MSLVLGELLHVIEYTESILSLAGFDCGFMALGSSESSSLTIF